ncbi:MAG: outer membrane lipoprotein carrier protein LolA [Rickettsiaceae bacterium]|nr:outer membrane lipoprotein carrier protein LolA [Rickettsiaceae bacterium]
MIHFFQQLTKIIFIFSLLLANIKHSYAIAANNSEIVDNITSYINNIKSIAVEFEQVDSNGNSASGMLIIDKPFKFRCNYYEPFPLLIVGNKNYVSVYDFDNKTLSRIKAKENAFYFLLVDGKFSDKFTILDTQDLNDNYIIKFHHHESNKVSQISFNKYSKQIQQLIIFEANNIIAINFAKSYNIHGIDKNLFILKNPKISDPPKRLDKRKLEKRFKKS